MPATLTSSESQPGSLLFSIVCTEEPQFIILPSGQDLVDVKVGDPGPTSDINQFRARQEEFKPEQKFKEDLAYIGEKQINTPHRKTNNKELMRGRKTNTKFLFPQAFVEM